MTSLRRWRIPPDAPLLWRHWPGEAEYVCYHAASGDTHRLSWLAGQMLERLQESGPCEEAALFATLAGNLPGLQANALDETLDALHQIHLVEPA